jgi:hypothetical protein
MSRVTILIVAGTLAFTGASVVRAGEADVVDAAFQAEPGGTFMFEVTVRHADEGWEHYADKWQVTGADGTVYGERVLAHPHVDEQPFTRSQGGIRIPEGTTKVVIRAHDSVHEWGGKEMTVTMPEE